MKHMRHIIIHIGQRIRTHEVQKLPPINIIMNVHRTRRNSLRHSRKVMYGESTTMSRFGIGSFAVEDGQVFPLDVELGVSRDPGPCFIDADDRIGFFGQCDDSCFFRVWY
jgi:hypothetical protein